MEMIIGVLLFCSVLFAAGATVLNRKERNRRIRIAMGLEERAKAAAEVDKKEKSINPLHMLETKANQAGLNNSSGFVLGFYSIICAVAGYVTGMLIFGDNTVAAVFVPVGMLIPYFILTEVVKRRRRVMAVQLAGALESISNMMRSGNSLGQALMSIPDRLDEPLKTEFLKIKDELRLGSSTIIEVLEEAEKRIPVLEMRMVVTSVQVHSQVGGNLAGSLDDIADTINKRNKMKNRVKSYTTQARLSGIVVSLVPFVVVILLRFMSGGEYLKPILDTGYGPYLFIACIISVLIGWKVMFSMADFKFE